MQLESLPHCEERSGVHRKSVCVSMWTRPQAGLLVLCFCSFELLDVFVLS